MSAGAPPARLRLTVAEGPLAGLELESDRPRPRLTLGRSVKTAQLQIKDPLVSERHAVFAWREGRWHLSDVGSTNGTFVNGSEARLEEGE
jgi:pSer/pThr/pTyr-binding forkhead associated (FHA) protein